MATSATQPRPRTPTAGGQGCRLSVSVEITEPVKHAISALGERAWQPAIGQDDSLRPGAAVAELTHQIHQVTLPAGWPAASRLIVRREPLHPGAQQTIDDIDGCRFTAMLTDQTDPDLTVLEQRHRARARAEDRIRTLKDLGMSNLPCGDFSLGRRVAQPRAARARTSPPGPRC